MKGYVFIQTFGCQMNVHDSEYMLTLLKSAGYEPTCDFKKADIILINTCAVRHKAEEKVYSLLGRLKPLKKKRPEVIIGVTGCVAQKEGPRILNKMPHVDLVIGTHQFYRIADFIEAVKTQKRPICCTEFDYQLEPPQRIVPLNTQSPVRAYVTVMQGCNNFCTYCIVPYVRGREISRHSENIIDEVKCLLDRGIKEVILLGQNVNSYGHDRNDEISFAELLRRIDKLPGLKRLRFITSHPKDLSDDLIQTFGELETLCEYIHLPAQSGSDRILKMMNRRYTRSDYLKKIEKLRKVRPNIAISTDLIVGFPGETEKDFKETLSLLQEVEYDGIFAFKYSDRPPAKAAYFKDKVPEEVKKERLKQVLEVQRPITEKKNRSLEGQAVEVLFDTYAKRDNQISGRTRCHRIVNVEADESLLGRLVKVKITQALAHSLKGEVIDAY